MAIIILGVGNLHYGLNIPLNIRTEITSHNSLKKDLRKRKRQEGKKENRNSYCIGPESTSYNSDKN